MKAALPKLAKDLASLVGIARKETSVEPIEAALVQAREKVAAAGRDRDAAEAAYRDGLLDATDSALAALQDRKAAATIERDRAEALVKALTERLAAAREADERAARKAIHDDASAKADAIKARFGAEYAHHAGAIRALLADLAAAEIAAEHANAEASEFGYIGRVEYAIRSGEDRPEEIISVEDVHLWTIDGRTEPVTADQQKKVRPANRPDRGYLPYGAGSQNGGQFDCTRRLYRRTTYRERIGSMDADSLLAATSLPRLHHLGDDFITSERWRGRDTALAHLTAERRPDPVLTRETRERLELVPEAPAPAETTVLRYPKREPEQPRTPSAREIRAAHTPSRIMATERAAG